MPQSRGARSTTCWHSLNAQKLWGSEFGGELLFAQLYIAPDRPTSTSQDNIHIIIKITMACKYLRVQLYISPPQWVQLSHFAVICQSKCLLNAEGKCCKWMTKMNVSKILLSAGSVKSGDREIGIRILFWSVLRAGTALVCSLPFLRSPFVLVNAMQWFFFSSSTWNQGHPLVCYHYLKQIPQPDLFPQMMLLQTEP